MCISVSLSKLALSENQSQVCYLSVVVQSMESYYHLKMFLKSFNMFWELFVVIKFI